MLRIQGNAMRAFKVIKDPEAFQILADETRRRIIYLLRAKEMTVSQLASELGLTPQAIYHHIRKLRDKEMVEVAREERVDHFIETYYQATAEVFHLSHGEGGSREWEEAKTLEAVQALAKIGFPVRADAKAVSRIVEVEKRMGEIGDKSEWSDRVADLENVDFLVKQDVFHFLKLLSMSDREFDEYVDLIREHRRLVRSLASERTSARAESRKS